VGSPRLGKVTPPATHRDQVSGHWLISLLLLRPQSSTGQRLPGLPPRAPTGLHPAAPQARGRKRRGVPSHLTWGGGARSWQLVEGSDAAPPRAESGQTELFAGDRHAHPLGPWLSPPRGWRTPAVSTPRWDPYHRYFRRLRAPPCRTVVVPPS
jgi:hypothetical protein